MQFPEERGYNCTAGGNLETSGRAVTSVIRCQGLEQIKTVPTALRQTAVMTWLAVGHVIPLRENFGREDCRQTSISLEARHKAFGDWRPFHVAKVSVFVGHVGSAMASPRHSEAAPAGRFMTLEHRRDGYSAASK